MQTTASLTSTEMAVLWTAYNNDSMSRHVLKYFLEHVQDTDVQSILQLALTLSETHVQKISAILKQDNFPIPIAFSDEDVFLTAPPLYSEMFYLFYIREMGSIGLNAYAVSLSSSYRSDVVQYFKDCLSESRDLLIQASEIMLAKGVMVRAPSIPIPKESKMIEKKSFFAGFFHERRPLSALEIGNLYHNIQRNVMGITLITGFSQVAKSSKVRDFMMRGREIAIKHIEVFSSILRENGVLAPMASNLISMDSTTPPFSDKLMMYHVTALIAISSAQYGAAISTSPRHDVAASYIRLSAEITQYAQDGANLMVENGWLEQPPLNVDRKELAKT